MKVSCDVRFYEDIYLYQMELSTDLTRLNPINCPQPNKKDEGINNPNLTTTPYIIQKTQNLSEPQRKRGRPRKYPEIIVQKKMRLHQIKMKLLDKKRNKM
jgi:hypothetical protein